MNTVMIGKRKIGIYGLGNMGRAIFDIIHKNLPSQYELFICSTGINENAYATCMPSFEDLYNTCDIIFLCIKPQDFYAQNFTIHTPSSPIIISIMAGVPIIAINEKIPSIKIVRSMPNLPLRVGRGVIGWFTDTTLFSVKEVNEISQMFDTFGLAIQLQEEDQINAITAISGSGPAYVFLFIDALIRSAQDLGFTHSQAREIAMETIYGSLDYAHHFPDTSLPHLIAQITSKKGTTEAALKHLNIESFYALWQEAVHKAYERAKEISTYEKSHN